MTWQQLKNLSPDEQKEFLLKRCPSPYKSAVRDLISTSGLGKHDLILPYLFLEIEKLKIAVEDRDKEQTYERLLMGNESNWNKIKSWRLGSNDTGIIGEVRERQMQLDKLLAAYVGGNIKPNEKSPRKETTKKEEWLEWIQTPTGTGISVIAVLLLLVLIF